MDTTQTGIPTVRSQLIRIADEREREGWARIGRAVGITVSVLAIVGTLGGGVWRLGEVSAQQQQTRSDVARVLVVVEGLHTEGATVRETLRVNEAEHERIRTDLRTVEQKLYDARRMSRPAGGVE
jgi:hypothetical protein